MPLDNLNSMRRRNSENEKDDKDRRNDVRPLFRKALEAVAGVETAEVSHETGTAEVTLRGDVSDEALAKAVTDAGYKVAGIE